MTVGTRKTTRWLRAALGLLLVGGGLGTALGWTFVRRPLPVPPEPIAALPAAPTVRDVALTRIPTARVETSAGFSVRGGSLLQPLVSAMTAFVVDHPDGLVLIDAGMGRDGVAHVATTPPLMQAIITLELRQGTVDGLAAADIAPDDLWGVIPTHAHWDHVSGLAELPGVPVWLTEAERAHTAHDAGGLLYRQIDAAAPVDVHTIPFSDGPHGPFPASWDVFGDGALVVLPLDGHTPGSVAVLVTLPGGDRVLFIGDTAWTGEGVDWPAEKPWLSRRMVDHDAARVRDQLVDLHRLARQTPGLLIVPAHDERIHEAIPILRARVSRD